MFTEKEIDAALQESQNFKPFAHYDAEWDSFEFFATNESFYTEHIDELVAIYYGQETNNVVGLRLKKVKRFFREFLKNAPGFKTEIQDHRIKVEHLFTAKIWSSAQEDGRGGCAT